MKVVFLNTWGGQAGFSFEEFVKKESLDTDIFCFQEVTLELYPKVSEFLENWESFFNVGRKIHGAGIGQAIYVKDHKVISSGSKRLHQSQKETPGDVGFLVHSGMKIANKTLFIGNVHGMTFPGDKLDTKERLVQSETIIDFFEDKNGPKIIGGDFNLLPTTDSIKMFEEKGYRNLIKDYKIKTTRNNLAWERHKEERYFKKQYFADFCFVSPDVKVDNFDVPNIEISDHLPLILSFDI